ncbi:glucan endo-1,3-beta-glucosidase 1 [Rosa sericea]
MVMMIGGRFNYGIIVFLILLGHFFCSGLKVRIKEQSHEQKQLHITTSISTTQKDITTPITTVPTITPTTPTSSTPIMNPTSTPDSTSPFTTTPSSTTTTSSTSASWCVASPSASQMALQVALDYACGYGGTDCSEIQLGRSCYNPNTVRDHASFAFNNFYQKNPVPNSCNFGGTAVITNNDPSTGTCQYPSTSTSSSVLNTTNSSGSTVFGAVPSGPSTSSAAAAASSHSLRNLFTMMSLTVVLLA